MMARINNYIPIRYVACRYITMCAEWLFFFFKVIKHGAHTSKHHRWRKIRPNEGKISIVISTERKDQGPSNINNEFSQVSCVHQAKNAEWTPLITTRTRYRKFNSLLYLGVLVVFQFRRNVKDILKPNHDDHYLLRWLRGKLPLPHDLIIKACTYNFNSDKVPGYLLNSRSWW